MPSSENCSNDACGTDPSVKKETDTELWLTMMKSMLNFTIASTNLMKCMQNTVPLECSVGVKEKKTCGRNSTRKARDRAESVEVLLNNKQTDNACIATTSLTIEKNRRQDACVPTTCAEAYREMKSLENNCKCKSIGMSRIPRPIREPIKTIPLSKEPPKNTQKECDCGPEEICTTEPSIDQTPIEDKCCCGNINDCENDEVVEQSDETVVKIIEQCSCESPCGCRDCPDEKEVITFGATFDSCRCQPQCTCSPECHEKQDSEERIRTDDTSKLQCLCSTECPGRRKERDKDLGDRICKCEPKCSCSPTCITIAEKLQNSQRGQKNNEKVNEICYCKEECFCAPCLLEKTRREKVADEEKNNVCHCKSECFCSPECSFKTKEDKKVGIEGKGGDSGQGENAEQRKEEEQKNKSFKKYTEEDCYCRLKKRLQNAEERNLSVLQKDDRQTRDGNVHSLGHKIGFATKIPRGEIIARKKDCECDPAKSSSSSSSFILGYYDVEEDVEKVEEVEKVVEVVEVEEVEEVEEVVEVVEVEEVEEVEENTSTPVASVSQSTSSEDIMVQELKLEDLEHQLRSTQDNITKLKREIDRLQKAKSGIKPVSANNGIVALYQEIMKSTISIDEMIESNHLSFKSPSRKG